jgi:Fe-S oxidoreductase
LRRFKNVAARSAAALAEVAKLGIPIIGLEPAVTLTYRDEYVHALGRDAITFEVKLLQEYLAERLPELSAVARPVATEDALRRKALRLLGHCTERTAEPASQAQWQRVFRALGRELELVQAGCCGMCGVYGHESEHPEESRGVFEMSWRKALSVEDEGRDLVTGHSCRSQVKRFGGFVPRHPVEALRELLAENVAVTA